MTRPINAALPTCHDQNIEFICEYFGDTVNQWRHAEKITMSHIKMNAIYWATCSLALLDKNRLEQYYSQILSYVQACWNIEIGIFFIFTSSYRWFFPNSRRRSINAGNFVSYPDSNLNREI